MSEESDTFREGISATKASLSPDTEQSVHKTGPKLRKKVTTACDNCKQNKAKCNGKRPCAQCSSKLRRCTYDAPEDRRIRSSEKRRIEYLEQENRSLRSAIDRLYQGIAPDDLHSGKIETSEDDTESAVPQSLFHNDSASNSLAQNIADTKQWSVVGSTDRSNKRFRSSKGQSVEPPGLSPGSTRSFGNLPFSSALVTNHFPISEQGLQLRNFQLPAWQILPQWKDDNSNLGRVYTAFHQYAQDDPSVARSACHPDLVDATLLFRKRRSTDPFSPDSWASEFQASFGDSVAWTINLAGTYMLARFMRWLLNPSPTTYAAVPAMMKMTLRQRMSSHPASIDIIGIPTIRDALITNMRDSLDAIFSAGLTISWPYSVNEALVAVYTKGSQQVYTPASTNMEDHIFISPRFARYIDNPKNWVFGRSILYEFPELAESEITISEEDVVRPADRWL